MPAWKIELNDLLEKIERHTSASLWRIKKEFERSGLTFDKKFRKRFLRLTNNRLSETFDRIEIEAFTEDRRSSRGQSHYRATDSDRSLGRWRNSRERSEEWESSSKRPLLWSESKDRRMPLVKRTKPAATTKRLGVTQRCTGASSSQRMAATIHKRLGKKVESQSDDDDRAFNEVAKSQQGMNRDFGRNPFRSGHSNGGPSSSHQSRNYSTATNGKQWFSTVKVKVEPPSRSPTPSLSPSPSRCSNYKPNHTQRSTEKNHSPRKIDSLKRKRDTQSESESYDANGCEEVDCKKQKLGDENTESGTEKKSFNLKEMSFYCVHCTDSNELNDSTSGSIEDVYGHWLSGHTDLKNIKPFWFYVTGLVSCFHCEDVACNYFEMVAHHKRTHPDKTMAIVMQTDRTKCGLCQYTGTEMVDHFAAEHDGLLQSSLFNPARLSESLLVNLFGIDIHIKRQCGHCYAIFETQHEIENHHAEAKHDGELISKEFFDSQSAYVICDHCSAKVDGTKFFNHIEKHRLDFACSKCDFKTCNVIDLIVHEKDEHRTNALNYHCLEFSERLKRQFFNSKVVFGNGLVLTNHNFKSTIYDDSKQFNTFIDSLIDKIKRTFNRMMEEKGQQGHDMDGSSGASTSQQRASCDLSNPSPDKVNHSSLTDLNPFRVSSMPSLMVELDKQNQLDNNLSILGFPRMKNEDLAEMFMKLCKALKVSISFDDIARIYRNNGVNEPVIVKFRNYETKIMVKNSAHLRDVWSNDLFKLPPGEQSTKIFVNLHTTRFYGKMVSIAREARKTKSLHSYYLCKRGLVVKRTETSKERIVLSPTELIEHIHGDKNSSTSTSSSGGSTGNRSNKEHNHRSSNRSNK